MKITKFMRFLLIAIAAVMVFSLFACGETPEETESSSEEVVEPVESSDNKPQDSEESEPTANTESSENQGGEGTEPESQETVTTETDEVVTTETETDEVVTTETESEETTETTETETEAKPECQHTELTEVEAKAATCTEAGNEAYKTCVCGKFILADGTVADAAPVIPALDHAWDEGKITTEATCEGDGVKTFTCANDASHTKTEPVAAKGHAWDEGKITTEATCESDGVKTFTCANDASHTKTEPVAAKGHAFNGNWVLNEAKPGYFKDECANGCSAIQEKACAHEDITLGATVATAPLTTSFTCKTCSITGATDKYNTNGGMMFGAAALKDLADTQTSKKNAEYSATVMTDADQNNLSFVRFELTADLASKGEGFLYLVENGDEKIDLGGKVIFIIYRTGNGNTTGIFETFASNGATWPNDFNNTARASVAIAQDGEWRAVVLNHTAKNGWTADGVQQLRLDIFGASADGAPTGAYTDIAYIGAFDTVDNAWAHYKSMLDVYKFETANYQYSNGGLKINAQSETITLTKNSPYIDAAQSQNLWYSADLAGKTLTVANQEITPQPWWIVTPGGIKACNLKITDATTGEELYNDKFRDSINASNSAISATEGTNFGSDRYVGGSCSVGHMKLDSFSGKTVNIEMYVITNYGQIITLMVLTNCVIG